MAEYLFLIPLLPLLASAFNLLVARTAFPDRANVVATLAVFGSFLLSVLVFREIYNDEHALHQTISTWIESGSFSTSIGLYADQLTAVMLLMVTFVSTLVHIYASGYMKGDPSFYRFFSWLPLFVFAMLVLVMADNYLLIFFGWEGVGLCSYLLIGFYHRRRSAGNAAKKAFIVNRIGDFGFGLGIMLIFTTFGTLSFAGDQGVFHQVTELGVSERTLTWIALLLFTGAIGKSAQFPLHVWLPDAMEGPTPVSALIHAATMVTAGIYLLARSSPILREAGDAMMVIAIVGAFTAFLGASIATVQNDIKRVVAYSTVSQLGYMALAIGVGAWVSAIFHLVAHAFFKACLFLGSGSVIHGMHEEQNIQKMGGLRKYMPITFWTFLIASLANAGVVPLAGFWSKDEIITGAWASNYLPGLGNYLAIFALITALITAYYMFRLIFLTFFGEERFDHHHVHPHESPKVMTLPLVILAAFAIGFGALGFPPDEGRFHDFLNPVFYGESHHDEEATEVAGVASDGSAVLFSTAAEEGEAGHGIHGHPTITDELKLNMGIVSTVVALSGILIAFLIYQKKRVDVVRFASEHEGFYNFLYNKWYFDDVYDRYIVFPLRRLSAWLWQKVDVGGIDGLLLWIVGALTWISGQLRRLQTGLVSNYALAIALGMVVLVGFYFAAFSDLFR
ncbi:MAG: NADH-quinone oxidoreductase subunit L [Thermomicrobiales bacterium]|nr:NADH-quinone oxidoreductase subunit L [Thermomicrobiales bacterium]